MLFHIFDRLSRQDDFRLKFYRTACHGTLHLVELFLQRCDIQIQSGLFFGDYKGICPCKVECHTGRILCRSVDPLFQRLKQHIDLTGVSARLIRINGIRILLKLFHLSVPVGLGTGMSLLPSFVQKRVKIALVQVHFEHV